MSPSTAPLIVHWLPHGSTSLGRESLPASIPGLHHANDDVELIPNDPLAALVAAHARHPDHDLLLLRGDLVLPDGLWPRMAGAWAQSPTLGALSCLDATILPKAAGMKSADVGAACWRHGEHAVFATDFFGAHASLWRAQALCRWFGDQNCPPTGLRDAAPRAGLLPCAWTENELPLAAFVGTVPNWLRPEILATGQEAAGAQAGDGRPVLLHVLHAWGGGIECFARDLQAGDSGRTHLFLVSRHDHHEPPFGRRMALHADLDAPPLRSWELSLPIGDTCVNSPEIPRLLADIIDEWGVGAVLVSSLIGHSLDVLRTGLPTAVCTHDVYPAWPLLHDRHDPQASAFDQQTLAQRLADPREALLFPHRDPAHWHRLREAYVQALVEHQVGMAAPSAFARERICAIEPRLRALDWQQIAHGSPVMPRLPHQAREHDRPLRVLVPGHIPGGKGEWLLRELLPRLDKGFELLLAGAGPSARKLPALANVRVIDHYRREELPALVADFQPDVALLPSTVPETWGYVLGEMLQLGIPVLASRLGAYAERMRDGVDGWLVEPTADAMHAALLGLRSRPGDLDALAGIDAKLPSLGEMAAGWNRRLPALDFAPRLRVADSIRTQALAMRRLEPAGSELREEIHHLYEQNQRLDILAADEREQRQMLELDLDIQRDRLELAENQRTAIEAEMQALRAEAVELLQSHSMLEDQVGRQARQLQAQAEAGRQASSQRQQLESELAGEREAGKQLRETLAQQSSELLAARGEALKLGAESASLRRELATSMAAFEDQCHSSAMLEQTIAELRAGKTRLEQDLSAGEQALRQSGQALDELQRQLTSAQAEATQLQQREAAAQAAIAKQQQHESRLREQLAREQARLEELHHSTSWRITAPLRAIKTQWLAWSAGARYRGARQRQWLQRALHSLRSRGLRGSWQRFRQQRPANMESLALITAAVGERKPPAFTPAAAPRASIIIPVYNQIPITLDCLASIAEQGADCAFEVIVVDDCSGDPQAALLAKIPGLRLHRNETNQGFIGACNAGAALARGEFLVFLNNDTLVQPRWLDALLETFDRHPDTGLAGSKLVYPDGRLQEAGGIVFSDASGWNYGRYADPAHPAFNFVREADYCSGAAIAIRRALFDELGGFDRHYAPAYYEDTDLAMRVRQRGLKVRYQPASVVVHLEGATSGTDLSQGAKAYQVSNQRKFLERWQSVLAQSHPAAGSDIAQASNHRSRKRVLVIDACTPMPDRDSGSVRMSEILRLLCEEGHAVEFFADNRMHDGRYTEALQQLGVQVWWHPWLDDVPAWLREHGPRLDAVIVSRHYILTPLLSLLRQFAPRAKIVFDTVDLHFLREEREAEQRGDEASRRAAQRTREAELALVRDVDETWVVSPVEQQLLAQLAPDRRVEILSNIHRPRGLGPSHGERADLMFVGGYRHTPNVDAAVWLATEIFPLIRLRRPDIRLHLVGADTPDDVRKLGEKPGVIVHGHIPDLVPMMDSVRLNLAPLRYGAGVKGKVNHSLAHGLPVVATHCAAEGMNLVDRIDAMVADGAVDFARAVLDAYDDAALWRRLADAGLENTRRHFSPERALPVLRNLLA